MKFLLNSLTVLLFISSSFGQEPAKATLSDIEALVKSRAFEFVAESANPMRGRTIFLSPGYTLTIRPDSVISYLPYYGRAYQASFDPGSAGIKFTSTEFEYVEKPGKKGGWNIQLRPKDVQHGPQLRLTISLNGQASLLVTSNDRESISFYGQIRGQSNP
jgi:hypothetical protein